MPTDSTSLSLLTLIVSGAFSALTVAATLVTIYLQFVRAKGPHIEFLSARHVQRARVLPFDRMPPVIQQNFPNLLEPNPGYFIVEFALANSGDRTAFVWVKDVKGNLQGHEIHASFYDYAIVPPGSVILHRVLARNVPELYGEERIVLTVESEWGGIKRGRYRATPPTKDTVPVRLVSA